MRVSDFAANNGILISSTLLKDNKDGFLWEVTLTYGTQTYTTTYHCGRAFQQRYDAFQTKWVDATYVQIKTYEEKYRFCKSYGRPLRPTPPSVANVLNCLLSDIRTIEDYPLWEDWVDGTGGNADSISQRRIYKACRKTYLGLRKFFGVKWSEFLACEEE